MIIYARKKRNGKVIGYLTYDEKKYGYYTPEELMKVIDMVENAEIRNGKIVGTQGNFDRYPSLNMDKAEIWNQTSATVLGKSDGKIVFIYASKMVAGCSEEDLIRKMKNGSIALTNACMVHPKYSKPYIKGIGHKIKEID